MATPLPPVPDRHTAQTNASLLIEEAGTNVALSYTCTKGDALSVNAPYWRRERFSTSRHSAVCLEPRRIIGFTAWSRAES